MQKAHKECTMKIKALEIRSKFITEIRGTPI